ncbi:MAG: YmaF family protein [Erysipelotrichaceae bacterium]|nr:YmaF family protein [Erysipelotrichaceae bacterium]
MNNNNNFNNTLNNTINANMINNGFAYQNSETHVHELQGVVKVAQSADIPHNHRFSTMTSHPIPINCNNHVHEVSFATDVHDGHQHTFSGRTSPAIMVGDRHVHFLRSITSRNDGHRHEFRTSAFIENPSGD